jgi:LuxR family maltose regulon positive regulatory protein
VREHARLLLTTALYLLNTVAQTTQEQRARVYQQARQLMMRVETALPSQADEASQEISATGVGAGTAFRAVDLESHAAEEALLQRRLRLLHTFMFLIEATAKGESEHFIRMQQEIQEELERDEGSSGK